MRDQTHFALLLLLHEWRTCYLARSPWLSGQDLLQDIGIVKNSGMTLDFYIDKCQRAAGRTAVAVVMI